MREDRKKVIEFYDSLAKIYDDLYGEEQDKKHEIVLQTLLNLKRGIVLDLGCGTGELSIKMSKLGWTVIAADISLRMLEVAKHKGVKNAILCSFDNLPFRPQSFDLIVAITVFSNQDELESFIGILETLLKKEGGIIASIPKKGVKNMKLREFRGVKDAFLFLCF